MGFNRRKMEDQRRQLAEKDAAARRATDAQVLEDAEHLIVAWNKRQAKRMPMLFSPDGSIFVFAPVGVYVTEFSRALDKLTFSPGAFLVVRGLIAERLDFPICHLDCFAPAFFAARMRGNAASKTALCQPLDCHRPRRMIALFPAPLIYGLQE